MDQFYEADKLTVSDTYKTVIDYLKKAKDTAGTSDSLKYMAKIRAELMKMEFSLLHYEDVPYSADDVIINADKTVISKHIDDLVDSLADAVDNVEDAFPSIKEYRSSLEEVLDAKKAGGDPDVSDIENMLAATGGDEGLRQARNSFMIGNLKRYLVDIENQLGLLVAKDK